jgi:glycosyltransferase involved in cell wall biosynthesis
MLARVKGLRVIRNATNEGFVAACNQGAAVARGEFILFLNNDTVVQRGWLTALVATIGSDARIGAVGAKLVYPDGRLQEAGGIIWNDGSGWNYGHGDDPSAPEFNFLRDVDYCSAACLLVRREAFEKLGGFDPQYAPAYYEDTDFCFRLRERDYRVVYQPAAEVVHHEGATAGTDPALGFKKYQAINLRTFARRHARTLAERPAPGVTSVRAARERKGGYRILVVDYMVPHPDKDSGSVRMAAILRILLDLGHRVTFLPDNLARIEPYTFELQQTGVEVLYGARSASFFEHHLTDFDVVILCRAPYAIKYVSRTFASNRRPFIIFDTVDLHHLREQRRADLENDVNLRGAASTTRAAELATMYASDMVWVTSTYEADLLRGLCRGPRIEVVPNIHDVRDDVPPFSRRRDLLFIGSFLHPPNEDAVLYFVRDILPLIRAALPAVRLLVAGGNAPDRILALACHDVKILGHVPDVAPVFDCCRVSVAPLRYGAGMKGKIGQSLAWGVPVVTTPVGAEGMRLVHRENVMIGSDAADFARSVIELYQDEALWTRLADNGRRHIRSLFGYDSVRATVDSLLRIAETSRSAYEAASPGTDK